MNFRCIRSENRKFSRTSGKQGKKRVLVMKAMQHCCRSEPSNVVLCSRVRLWLIFDIYNPLEFDDSSTQSRRTMGVLRDRTAEREGGRTTMQFTMFVGAMPNLDCQKTKFGNWMVNLRSTFKLIKFCIENTCYYRHHEGMQLMKMIIGGEKYEVDESQHFLVDPN